MSNERVESIMNKTWKRHALTGSDIRASNCDENKVVVGSTWRHGIDEFVNCIGNRVKTNMWLVALFNFYGDCPVSTSLVFQRYFWPFAWSIGAPFIVNYDRVLSLTGRLLFDWRLFLIQETIKEAILFLWRQKRETGQFWQFIKSSGAFLIIIFKFGGTFGYSP